jgi:hypothetical protein
MSKLRSDYVFGYRTSWIENILNRFSDYENILNSNQSFITIHSFFLQMNFYLLRNYINLSKFDLS